MIDLLAEKMTSFLLFNKEIKKNEYDIYKYGFEALLINLVSISIIILTSFILNQSKETIIFLIFYCLLRQFTGGYHAKNKVRCFIFFEIIYIVNMKFIILLQKYNITKEILIGSMLCGIIIIIISPIIDNKKLISLENIKFYKRIIIFEIFVYILISLIILYKFENRVIFYCINLSIITVLFMQIMRLIKKIDIKLKIVKILGYMSMLMVFFAANTTSIWLSYEPEYNKKIDKYNIFEYLKKKFVNLIAFYGISNQS